jgi:hypothetical protein
MAVRSPRLPGIRFEAVEPLRDDLPRMDIAVFAGFAAAGPLNLPVAVEDVAEYAAIFGGDLALAYDPDRGARNRAHLPQSVRAFFRNGGRRCWVIRVADEETAESNRFRVPGLWRPQASQTLDTAWAEARSPGSWSDNVRVTTGLRSEALGCTGVRLAGPARLEVGVSGARDLARGDLLRLTFVDPRSPVDEPRGYLLAVDHLGPTPSTDSPLASPLIPAPLARWVAGPAWPFRLGVVASPLADGSEDPDPMGSTPGELWESAEWTADDPFAPPPDSTPTLERLTFDLIASEPGSPSLRLRGLGFAPDHPRYWAALPCDVCLLRPTDRPSTTEDDLTACGVAAPELRAAATTPRFPLCGRGAGGAVYLPAGMRSADAVELGPLVWAGDRPPAVDAGQQPTPSTDAAVASVGATHGTGMPLERDGLGRFDVGLFLDPRLANVGSERLVADGSYIRYEAPRTRHLRGIHAALLELEEASLIATPDADHRGWQTVARPPVVESTTTTVSTPPPAVCTASSRPRPYRVVDGRQALAAPRLATPVRVRLLHQDEAIFGSYRLGWSSVPEADVGYVLEEARRDDFGDSRQVFAGRQATATMTGREPGRYLYRVRALGTAGVSPWSPSIEVRVGQPDGALSDETGMFVDCDVLPAPRISIPVTVISSSATTGASFRIHWSRVRGADVEYIVEVADGDDFREGYQVYAGANAFVAIKDRPEGIYFYRVRALGSSAASSWSVPIQVRVEPAEPAELVPLRDFDEAGLTRVHQATLALCAARGDIVAVLTLPEHYREEDAIAHCDRLVATTEDRALSFGALYHPWLIGRGGELSGEPGALPPDGAVTGQIARRTLLSGAWFAPANDPLVDVLALTPVLQPVRRLELQEAGVNLVRHEPRGFLVLAANTLTRDDELRALTVRRLLILLRRLALRRGTRYVFEPNDPNLRRIVERGFEATLDDLFVRGAFAGDTPEHAYQVDAGPSLNTRQSIDAGRFIVELRVAPSRPLTFVTVRLVQSGDRPLAVLER